MDRKMKGCEMIGREKKDRARCPRLLRLRFYCIYFIHQELSYPIVRVLGLEMKNHLFLVYTNFCFGKLAGCSMTMMHIAIEASVVSCEASRALVYRFYSTSGSISRLRGEVCEAYYQITICSIVNTSTRERRNKRKKGRGNDI